MFSYKVSVIIPVYNVEKYIERCARSLMEQTLDEIEYIFIDDCSSDNSVSILEVVISDYPERQKSVSIYKQPFNGGQAKARNKGIELAKGEYISFVDSDDWIDNRMLETLYENAQKNRADISCCGIERVNNKFEHVSFFNDNICEFILYHRKEAEKEILENIRITSSPCDKIYTTSILKKNPMIEGMIFEDFEVMPRWVNCAERIVYDSRPFYKYRYNPHSTMGVVTIKRLDEVTAGEKRISFYSENYPELKERVILRHIEVCLNVLSCTVGAIDNQELRYRLVNKIRKTVTFKYFVKLDSYSKTKFVLLFGGLKFFDKIAKLKR